ncbi:MAG: hypothetical protein WC381_06560 [Kiritimatiellia bacterium]|jgi:predicted RNA-binding Zn-ribbon protein involved in translation (DUF1610 family)
MKSGRKTNLLILSIYRELAEEFLSAFNADPKTEAAIGDFLVHSEIVAGDPSQDPTFAEHLAKTDAIAIVVRFLDVLSLEKIKNIYRSLPDPLGIPVAIFMLRDKGEVDFKISCPSCGQKLWLRDTDVAKRGRCPNCTKPFVILAQGDHLKSQLILPDKVETFKVTRTNPESFQDALIKLFGGVPAGIKPVDLSANEEALKNATVRIQIQNA